jgi:hypothetical protein
MKPVVEKMTFGLAALLYLLMHLRLGSSSTRILLGTLEQLLTTLPYCLGFTWIVLVVIRFLHQGKWPSWDRILRIFFTFGILLGFYFSLYEYAAQQQPGAYQKAQEAAPQGQQD